MRQIVKLLLAIASICILFGGCKSLEQLDNKMTSNMPSTYVGSKKDTLNNAAIKWKEFFSDTNLTVLIQLAVDNNLDLSVAIQRMEIAKASVKASKGALLPTVSGNLSYWQRKFGYYTMDDAGNRTTEIEPGKIIPTNLPDFFVGLQTSWEVDIWGKLRNKKKAAVARYLASVEGKNAVLTNLIAEVAIHYYNLLALDNQLEIIRQTINLQENALELVRIQKQVAVVNELAVQQFEAELLDSRAYEYELLQEIFETENAINFLLGRYPQTINRKKDNLNKNISVETKVGIPSDLLRYRPDIRQAEYELVASRADLRSARAAFYPSLNITGTGGFQGYKTAFLFEAPQSLAYSVIGSLITPLVNRSAIKAQFKSAKANQLEALYNYQESILKGYVEVNNELSKINNYDRIVSYKSDQVNVLTRSVETSTDLFKSGHASYIEVLMAQRSSINSKLKLINARQERFRAVINLYKALGGGWQ